VNGIHARPTTPGEMENVSSSHAKLTKCETNLTTAYTVSPTPESPMENVSDQPAQEAKSWIIKVSVKIVEM
jgi:hypothetical protein